jgi:hypothetical protein
VLVAVADPVQPGLYFWEVVTGLLQGFSPVIRTTATGIAIVTTYDTPIVVERTGFLLGMRLAGGIAPGGQAILANLRYNGGAQVWPALGGPSLGAGVTVGSVLLVPISPFAVNAGDYFLVQNEQVGSGPAGSDIDYNLLMG